MTFRTATKAFLVPAAGVIGVVIVALHYGRGSAVGLGAVLAGAAAVAESYSRATKAERKTDVLADRMNGGLAAIAREHVQDNEVIAGLVHRMNRYEAESDARQAALDDCYAERRDLHERLIDVLTDPRTMEERANDTD